jgi:hypothetical protein
MAHSTNAPGWLIYLPQVVSYLRPPGCSSRLSARHLTTSDGRRTHPTVSQSSTLVQPMASRCQRPEHDPPSGGVRSRCLLA